MHFWCIIELLFCELKLLFLSVLWLELKRAKVFLSVIFPCTNEFTTLILVGDHRQTKKFSLSGLCPFRGGGGQSKVRLKFWQRKENLFKSIVSFSITFFKKYHKIDTSITISEQTTRTPSPSGIKPVSAPQSKWKPWCAACVMRKAFGKISLCATSYAGLFILFDMWTKDENMCVCLCSKQYDQYC